MTIEILDVILPLSLPQINLSWYFVFYVIHSTAHNLFKIVHFWMQYCLKLLSISFHPWKEWSVKI